MFVRKISAKMVFFRDFVELPCAAFMYAAAWYNTQQFYASDGAVENQPKAVDYYCDQYRKMMMECMHDFSGNNR
jgi:hypothetical protein